MKSDARVRYTKMVIKNSFVKLLAKKPLEKVTVKEICELSEINRATFYKYYCIIDRQVIWYESMSFLGKEDAEDNLMFVADAEIASELLELMF